VCERGALRHTIGITKRPRRREDQGSHAAIRAAWAMRAPCSRGRLAQEAMIQPIGRLTAVEPLPQGDISRNRPPGIRSRRPSGRRRSAALV